MLLWQIYVPGNNKAYLVLNTKGPKFLSGFNLTRIFSTDVLNSHYYQLWWKSVQWQPPCYMRTDEETVGQTEMSKLISAFRDYAK